MGGCWSRFGWVRRFVRKLDWRWMGHPGVLEVELSQQLGLVGEMPFRYDSLSLLFFIEKSGNSGLK